VGRSPNVGKFAARPLSPFEHATPLSEPAELSNVVSNVARAVIDRVLDSACGRARATCVRRRARANLKRVEEIIVERVGARARVGL
jgi:hypothetical protein